MKWRRSWGKKSSLKKKKKLKGGSDPGKVQMEKQQQIPEAEL